MTPEELFEQALETPQDVNALPPIVNPNVDERCLILSCPGVPTGAASVSAVIDAFLSSRSQAEGFNPLASENAGKFYINLSGAVKKAPAV